MAGEQSPGVWGGDDEESMSKLGFRFKPTLRELVEFYLLPKLLDKPTVPNDAVIEADTYECDPEILTKRYEDRGADDNWYFLSPRSRRYPGGDRPSRRTADDRGRWKPSTGQSKPGKKAAAGHSKGKKGLQKNLSVGAVEFTENTLAYYVGEPKNETKTKWLMHELTVPEADKDKDPDAATSEKPRDSMLLNKYVMCRIYKSPLKKWKEPEDGEGSTSSAAACDEEVPASSQSGAAPESVEEVVAPTPSSKRAGKRPAVEQPGAPNKRAFQQTVFPASPGPITHANGGGGGGTRVPVGAGAAGYYHGVPGLPPLVEWPPAMYNSLQAPVQLQRPPAMYDSVQGAVQPQRPPAMYNSVQLQRPPPMYNSVQGSGQPPAMYNSVQGPVQPQGPPAMYNTVQEPVKPQRPPAMYNSVQEPVQPQRPPAVHGHNGQAPVQGPPGLRLFPPHRAAATAPNSLGRKMMTRPQNPAAGQPARPPSLPRPPRQHQIQHQHQQQQMESMQSELQVYAQLAAEIKLQKALQAQESASCAGQQQIKPTAPPQPASFDGGAAANHPTGAEVTVPCPQFPAPDNCYPCSGAQQQQQQQQQQQSGSAITEASVPPGAAAPPVETTTAAADNDAPSKLSVPRVASEGSEKGNCYDYSNLVSGDSSEGSRKGSYYNFNNKNFFADFLAAMQN